MVWEWYPPFEFSIKNLGIFCAFLVRKTTYVYLWPETRTGGGLIELLWGAEDVKRTGVQNLTWVQLPPPSTGTLALGII